MLLRDDMLDVVRESARFLTEQAVFATIFGPPPDLLSRRGIHQAEPFSPRERFAFILIVAMKSSALM